MAMQITNNGFNAETAQVEVVFEKDGFKHTRFINAVLDADGAYDEEATAERIEEHAAGVTVKMGLGVIRNENIPLPDLILPEPEMPVEPTGTDENPEETEQN